MIIADSNMSMSSRRSGKYKSAIVAFKNALKQYPESKRREEIMYLIVDSGYRLASSKCSCND